MERFSAFLFAVIVPYEHLQEGHLATVLQNEPYKIVCPYEKEHAHVDGLHNWDAALACSVVH